jgi:hypothetical protein
MSMTCAISGAVDRDGLRAACEREGVEAEAERLVAHARGVGTVTRRGTRGARNAPRLTSASLSDVARSMSLTPYAQSPV